MSSVITNPGENLIAAKQGTGQLLVIDKMIFANVPGVDPEATIDRSSQKPATEQIMQEYDIPEEYRAYVNPNQVVYSAVLDSNAGDYDFNWIGLYSSADDVIVAITTLPNISKFKTAGQIQGNHLTRNFMLSYEGAAKSTGMSVAADTWQLDFSVRLNGLDERDRRTNRDTYGRARFWKDGFKLVNSGGSFTLAAGVAYVEGIRIDLENPLPISGENLPKSVWLDVSLSPQGSTMVARVVPVYRDNYADSVQDGINHYFIKIAEIDKAGKVTDFRTVDNIETDLVEYLKNIVHGHEADPNAHMELLARLATGIVDIIYPLQNAVDIGETPVFTCNEFVPIFINTVQNGAQWQIDYASGDFSNPVFDSGPSAVALSSFEMPAGYLQVSNIYKVRCRRRLNTGQWSPWSEVVNFTTRSVFNYTLRATNIEPISGATNVGECPTFKCGPFAVAGDVADTHVGTQVRIRQGDTVIHLSPELGAVLKYKLPAGLHLVGNDYVFEFRLRGSLLGWGEWAVATPYRTAAAFITGDEAVYPSSWVGYDNASAAGVALADEAALRSNGIDQGEGEGDWVDYSARAKVRDVGISLDALTSSDSIFTKKKLSKGQSVLTNLGAVILGDVTLEGFTKNHDPFGDDSGVALYALDGSGVCIGAGNDITSGITGFVDDNRVGDIGANIAGVTNDIDVNVGSGDYAVSAMVNFTTPSFHGPYMTIASGDGVVAGGIYSYTYYNNEYKFIMDFRSLGAEAYSCSCPEGNPEKVVLKDGKSHHVVFNISRANNTFSAYCDGLLFRTIGYYHPTNHYTGDTLIKSFGWPGSTATPYNQVRIFKRQLTRDEIRILKGESLLYCADISAAGFVEAPDRVHLMPKLTATTGSAETAFTPADFTKIPIEKATLGTDSDPDRPNFILLESTKQTPAESFRRVALGVSGLSKDSECRVAETQIDTWKQGA